MLTIIRPPVKYKALTMGDGDMGIYAIWHKQCLDKCRHWRRRRMQI